MSLFERFFGKGRSRRHAVDLAALLACLEAALPTVLGQEIDTALLCRRFSGHCQDVGLSPLTPGEFAEASAGLDAEGRRRLALAIAALDRPDVRAALTTQRSLGKSFGEAFVGLAAETSQLSIDLLRTSPLRREELARHFLLRLGAHVEGESDQEFRERLERLDYGTVLSEAERARIIAEEHADYLRRLQEEQESLRPRRGKW
jgi:hypothetical protein